MTREKAIERLNHIKIHGADIPNESIDIQRRDIEALDMAIKALEEEPVLDKMKAEYKARLKELISMAVRVKHNTESIDVLIDILDILLSEVIE